MTRTTWRGVTVDTRTARMLDEVAALTPADLYVQPSQGSYSGGVGASAGTHDGCGAVDLMNLTPAQYGQLVEVMRRVGFAAWHRTPQQSSWPHHVHAIAVQPGGRDDRGCLSAAAHNQVRDYYAGRNGLASGAPDDADATRAYVGMTWERYEEEHMALSDNDVERIAREVATRVNGILGDFDAKGKKRDGQEGERGDARLRQVEKVVRKIARKVGA